MSRPIDLRKMVALYSAIDQGIAITNPAEYIVHLMAKSTDMGGGGFTRAGTICLPKTGVMARRIYTAHTLSPEARVCQRCLNSRKRMLRLEDEKNKISASPYSIPPPGSRFANYVPRTGREKHGTKQSR